MNAQSLALDYSFIYIYIYIRYWTKESTYIPGDRV